MRLELNLLLIGIAALLLVIAPAMASSVKITSLDVVGETVTVSNTGSATADLTGWTIIDDQAKHTFRFPNGFVLASGATVTVQSSPNQAGGAGSLSWTKQYVWNNEGDVATLVNPTGVAVSNSNGLDVPDLPVQTPTQVPTAVPTTVATAIVPVQPLVTVIAPPPVTAIPIVTLVTAGEVSIVPVVAPVSAPEVAPTMAPTVPPGNRFGTRKYVVGAAPKSPPVGITTGTGRGVAGGIRSRTVGTGIAAGTKPPSGRFVRWSPAARWKSGQTS